MYQHTEKIPFDSIVCRICEVDELVDFAENWMTFSIDINTLAAAEDMLLNGGEPLSEDEGFEEPQTTRLPVVLRTTTKVRSHQCHTLQSYCFNST